MSVKNIISSKYKDKVNKVAAKVKDVAVPPEGWLTTARKALSMSAAQLARRLNVTRAHVSNTEKAELSGSVTVKTLQKMAEGMGYRLVYAIVPDDKVEDILIERAREKAKHIVEETNKQMALEGQALTDEHIAFEMTRLEREILKNLSSDFWNDEE